jgi:enoyl-CoA hydratase/carnithine racemase
MTYKNELVLVDVAADGVATVTLNRPDKLNAMNAPMVEEFCDALWGLDDDPAVRAIVVTGAGKGYCAGVDISAGPVSFARDPSSEKEADADMVVSNFSLWRMRTPVIGAVNGAAIGAGLTTVLMFDIVFVASDAKLSFRFSRLGVLPEANSLWLLPRLIGVSRALDVLLSGRDFTGAEAVELGIAKEAHPAADVLAAAQAYGRELAASTSPISTTLIKRLVYEFLGETDRGRAMAEETDWTWWTGTQPDIVESITARTERRPPAWKTTKLDVPDKRPDPA